MSLPDDQLSVAAFRTQALCGELRCELHQRC
jgi:hypothetical protein